MDHIRWGMNGCGEVTEVKSGPAFKKIEDFVSASFAFESGVRGTATWCFSISDSSKTNRTEIVGNKGTITFSFGCFTKTFVSRSSSSLYFPQLQT